MPGNPIKSKEANEAEGNGGVSCPKKETGRQNASPDRDELEGLTEQPKDALFGLSSERQGLNTQLLAGLQGQKVRALLVEVGEREFVGRLPEAR